MFGSRVVLCSASVGRSGHGLSVACLSYDYGKASRAAVPDIGLICVGGVIRWPLSLGRVLSVF